MNQAFGNLIGLFTQNIEGIWFYHPAKTFEVALIKTAKLCAGNQSKLDGSFINNGRIAIGKEADITIGTLQNTNGDYTFDVQQTWVNGKQVYSA
jgi:alpha-D-ribose 1-methylphosphonate 5-triphosphate diphosphatase PhnM